MKKLLALLLVLVFCFAIVGCGGSSDNTDNGAASGSETASSTEKSNPYAGTWQHERTDAEPFAMNFELKEDGTGSMGNKNKVRLDWSEIEAGKIKIKITFSDDNIKDTTATVDGDTLHWDYSFNVQAADGTMFKVDSVNLKRK